MIVQHSAVGLHPAVRREGKWRDAEHQLDPRPLRTEPIDQREAVMEADSRNRDERPRRTELGQLQLKGGAVRD